MITERDLQILLAVVRYYVLSRQQIQRLCFPGDKGGRITRRRIQALISEKLLNRQNMQFCHPGVSPAPVYYPSRRGCELLAEHFDDERFLTTPTRAPLPHHVLHWLACSDTHIAFDEALARQEEAKIEDWLNEWDVVNKDESAPERRYRLYTLLRETPRLVCAPDAAFLLAMRGHAKVFYLEQDRNTSGVRQVAASKTQGYAVMAEGKLHRRHFPQSTVDPFAVLMVAPSARRRDALRKAISEQPGAALWRFASQEDLTPEKLLFEPIWHKCDGTATPLVKGGA